MFQILGYFFIVIGVFVTVLGGGVLTLLWAASKAGRVSDPTLNEEDWFHE